MQTLAPRFAERLRASARGAIVLAEHNLEHMLELEPTVCREGTAAQESPSSYSTRPHILDQMSLILGRMPDQSAMLQTSSIGGNSTFIRHTLHKGICISIFYFSCPT
jgi:hypothetical protein